MLKNLIEATLTSKQGASLGGLNALIAVLVGLSFEINRTVAFFGIAVVVMFGMWVGRQAAKSPAPDCADGEDSVE